MGKFIASVLETDTIKLSQQTDGYWLWDETRGMNLAMYAKTPEAAFVKALEYYQNRLLTVESKYNSLQTKVDQFVSQFTEDEEE